MIKKKRPSRGWADIRFGYAWAQRIVTLRYSLCPLSRQHNVLAATWDRFFFSSRSRHTIWTGDGSSDVCSSDLAAAPLVKRGGLLIYATGSLEPEEDSEIVNEFLARHPAFARARPGAVPAELLTTEGDFQTLPQHHAVDGAYAARLVRTR